MVVVVQTLQAVIVTGTFVCQIQFGAFKGLLYARMNRCVSSINPNCIIVDRQAGWLELGFYA